MKLPDWTKSLYFLLFTTLPLLASMMLAAVDGFFLNGVATKAPAASDRYASLVANPAAAGALHPLAVSDGRFEWMAFFMTADAIFFATIMLAGMTMWRNLTARWTFVLALGLAAGATWLWVINSVYPQSDAIRFFMDAPSRLALQRYNPEFAHWAKVAVLANLGTGLVATIFVILAGASVMTDTTGFADIPRTRKAEIAEKVALLERKSGDLKLMIFMGAILLAFLGTYASFWLKWPLKFVPPATPGHPLPPPAAEIEATANGLSLFIGAGYTIILLALAAPTVVAISNARRALGAPPPGGDKPFGQTLFSASEIASLLAIATPFVSALLGANFHL